MAVQESSILITAVEAAALCNICERSWWRLHAAKKLPACVRILSSVRWRKSDIELWIDLGCPSQSEFEAKKKCSKISKSNCLLGQVAEILLNLQTGAYTPEQSENASEVVEAVLRRHYEGGGSC